MKRAAVAFAVAMMAAGVASALAPGSSPPQTPSRDSGGTPPAPPSVASSASKPTLEARQAPVPFNPKPKATFRPPTFDSDAVGPVPAKVGSNSFGESRAKAAIEADGYKGVNVLRKDGDGRWRAEALRGKTKVLLIVDAQGNVISE